MSPNTITYSEKFYISYGTAQGSCLGPLLFLIFVNDIYHLELYSRIILFADVTTIFNSHKSPQFLQYTIVHDLHLLMNWFRTNKLSLNLTKTVIMLFGKNKIDFNIDIEGEIIPLVKHTKFLGVYLDNELSWQVHINHVLDKIQANKHLLSLRQNLLDSLTLKNTYYAHIHLHISYGLTVWGSMASKAQLCNLKKVQNLCIQIINKRTITSDITGQYEELKIFNVETLIKLHLCKLGHMISHSQLPTPIHKIFNDKGGLKRHRYPTRRKNTPNIQVHTLELFNKSFMCRGLVEYHLLPQYLKENLLYKRFVVKCKIHLTNNFQA